MYICVNCKKKMLCDKNSVGADFGYGHVYASDRYRCPSCDHMILATNERPYQDPEYRGQSEYLRVDER